MTNIKIYDTTLRDGSQAEGISFSLQDKIKITKKLDELGVHYIEGGMPGSNPKDLEFFQHIKDLELKNAKMGAFGATRRVNKTVEEDDNIKKLVDSGVKTVTIVGKSWDFQVLEVLKTSLENNLEMIFDTIKYLKEKDMEVMFDAEHFFDGYKENKEYALKTIKTAEEAGVDWIVLADTNGGTLSQEISDIVKDVKKEIKTKLGIHTHNDNGLAVANSIAAVMNGVTQIQGTINGFGERCGNANLCTLMPIIGLKMGLESVSPDNLKKLTHIARYIAEISNVSIPKNAPYIGKSAFVHKGGMHVSGVTKNASSYEHIDPSLIGNERRVVVSELSGKSNILAKANEFGIDVEKAEDILETVKDMENKGFQFESAEASFELLLRRNKGEIKNLFDLVRFKVVVESDGTMLSEASVKIKIDDNIVHTAAEGDGPVNALDTALRKALRDKYPEVTNIKLKDYKVRVLDSEMATAANVRVLIESSDGEKVWTTLGVSTNIIEASWHALLDGIEYGLLYKDFKKTL